VQIRTVAILASTVVLLLPLAADAARSATIGPQLPGPFSPVSRGCGAPFESCTFMLHRLEDGRTRAPFSGTIKRWRIQHPNGEFRLQVLKRRPDGTFKALRQTRRETLASDTFDDVRVTRSSLRIRRGQYVAIKQTQGSTFGLLSPGGTPAGDGDCDKGFVPGLAVGAAAEPSPSYSGCERMLLYNAKLVR
jgi:hypothetical protein